MAVALPLFFEMCAVRSLYPIKVPGVALGPFWRELGAGNCVMEWGVVFKVGFTRFVVWV